MIFRNLGSMLKGSSRAIGILDLIARHHEVSARTSFSKRPANFLHLNKRLLMILTKSPSFMVHRSPA